MSSIRVRKSERCAHENCGSRRFHIGDDGYTYCDQGHQQSERGTVIAEDTGEFMTLGRKTKRKDSDAESRTSKASSYSGADAFEHYLLCVQLVLRKQLKWLIEVQRLPDELEVLVKDLWALRLRRLQNKISYESETDTEGLSSQVFSSQSESESASASRSSRRQRNDIRPKEGTPSLIETLSLCYTGMLLLRIPVTVADMVAWVNDGDLLYYRAPRVVPLGMRERLPPRYQQMLEPQDLLPPETLHQGILDTLAMFVKDFGMALPPLNIPLILYRWIKDLALPLEVFAGTQRLARALNVDVGSFVPSKAVINVVLRYPEAQLMALIVIATKLLFPIDHIQRSCRAATDLSALRLDWDQWLSLHNEKDRQEKREPLTFEQAFNISESECFDATDEKIDAYLDWYGNNIASEEVREHGRTAQDADFRKTLFSMFPTGSEQRSGTVAHSSPEQTSPKEFSPVRRIVLHERAVCPSNTRNTRSMGSSYRRYRHVGELSGPSKLLFEKAAVLAGLSLESMVQAVFIIERKIQKSEEALRKSKSIRK